LNCKNSVVVVVVGELSKRAGRYLRVLALALHHEAGLPASRSKTYLHLTLRIARLTTVFYIYA
jgi:hypothetical protein